ncbi:MAG: hypothetical protein RBR97_06720 [Bacteroidales bacterium]|nr:hypothetical protein [Bacteroidales bacterium]MDY0141569.1 hypothetical protein [Bacteroidales bacterium]
MKVLQFRCKLITDVIINQKAATEGNQESLDFIPGSNFLGIVAQSLYREDNYSEASIIFHSGKVRFGDAHPAISNIRGLRVPAVMSHPKDDKEVFYIMHDNKELQLKQCRLGFYSFENNKGYEIPVDKSFAIKSAYDRNSRRSKDEAMYGYQSINAETTMFFEVEFDNDVDSEIIEKIKQKITGQKRIGRSRTAQYGLVNIEEYKFENIPSQKNENGIVAVYADSRLIFIDENTGLPTFRPTPKQLEIDAPVEAMIWELSQVRTFQYAPWNFKRQTRDADRCGIEKGSVFYVKSSLCPKTSQYVGSFKNEGFGKVIYNPEFLDADENYKAVFQLKKSDDLDKNKQQDNKNEITQNSGTQLITFLKQQQFQEKLEFDTIELVNEFVVKNISDYKGKESFASQWGNIRKIAMQYKTKTEIERELFTKAKSRDGKEIPDAYLTHGVAKEKWDDRNRRNKLKDFFAKPELSDKNIQFAIINLAAEMAKICRRTKNAK